MNRKIIIILIIILLFVGGIIFVNNAQKDDIQVENNTVVVKNDSEGKQESIDLKSVISEADKIEDESQKEKKMIPVYSQLLKEYKNCLELANAKNDALDCVELIDKKTAELGIKKEDNNKGYEMEKERIGDWTADKKEAMLKDIEFNLSTLGELQ